MATTIKFYPEDFLKSYRYKISDIVVRLNPTDSTVTEKRLIVYGNERILDFFIEENYEEYYYPIISLTITMSHEDYELIVSNKANAEFSINIRKEYIKGEEITTELGSAETMMRSTFNMVTDENVISLLDDIENYKEAKGTDYRQRTLTGYMYDENGNFRGKDDSEVISSSSYADNEELDETDWEPHTLYLFNSTLPLTRRTVNKVFKKGTVLQALLFVLNSMGIKDVLMPKINNNKRYKEMIIPPMTCLNALSFIDSYYGIFRKGALIFFDYDRSYIIPYSGKCDISEEGEKKTTCIIIPKKLNSNNPFVDKEGMIGKFVKKTNKIQKFKMSEEDERYNDEFSTETIDPTTNYIVADMTTVEINDDSVMLSYEGDGETSLIDPETGEMSSSLMGNVDYGQLSKYVVDSSLNPFLTSMYKARKQASNVKLVITFSNIDIDALKPNRLYNIIFEEKKYKKKFGKRYVLAGCRHQFILDGEQWKIQTRAVFRSYYNIKDASLPKINLSFNNGKRKKREFYTTDTTNETGSVNKK